MANGNDKPLKAQQWALWVALIVYVLLQVAYLSNADIPFIQIRGQADKWGQFGDYVGGVINPIVGLITIWLLTASLKQSQKEIAFTRKALQDTEASQKATEAALRDQLKVSEHARDMNNAIALLNHYREQLADTKHAIKMMGISSADAQQLENLAVEFHERNSRLLGILDREANRIFELHGPKRQPVTPEN